MREMLLQGLTTQAPALIILVSAIVILFVDSFTAHQKRKHLGGYALLGTLVSLVVALIQAGPKLKNPTSDIVFGNMAMSDPLMSVGNILILSTLTLGLFLGYRQSIKRKFSGEFHALLLFAGFGAMVMANASSLVTLVLGLEIMSLPLYTLAAFDYNVRASREAGLKYLILGSLSSGFMVLGCALFYAGTGTLEIKNIEVPISGELIQSIGCALILSGLMFKGGMLPFFAWSPDVYHGAPDFTVGLMAALAKLGTFIALIRIMPEFMPAIMRTDLIGALMISAAGTMFAGNILALVQTNIKRMLAFSSVAHAGYMFLGLLAFRSDASGGALFYLITYAPVLVLTFHLVSLFPGKDGGHELAEYTGIGSRTPFIALVFTICLLSLAGLPPTGGFMAKMSMFLGAVQGGLVNLVIFAMLVSVIGVYYYLRVVVYMYMREPREDTPVMSPSVKKSGPLGNFALAVIGILVLLFGLWPGFFLYISNFATTELYRLIANG